MKEDYENNISILKDMLLDEQKLVTYISLSKELSLHVNVCKSLLHEVVLKLRSSRPDIKLNVLYVISGVNDNSQIGIEVCHENDLPTRRQKYNRLIFEHVYALSTGSHSVDHVALLLTNTFGDLSLCKGIVKSDLCIKQSVEDKKSSLLKENTVVSNTKVNFTDFTKTNQVENIQSKKSKLETSDNTITTKTKVKKESDHKRAQKNITGFFNGNSTSISKKPKDETDVSAHTEIKMVSNNSKQSSNSLVSIGLGVTSKTKEFTKNQTEKIIKSQIEKKSNSLFVSTNKAKVEKNRKRLLLLSDSESESETNDMHNENNLLHNDFSEDEIPPSPIPEIKPIKKNPKKKRKVIEKTYTDEDGYILTKKEEIYESCSDEEETVLNKNEDSKILNKKPWVESNGKELKKSSENKSKEVKKSKTKNSGNKCTSQQKGKQSVMTNFFKKA